MGLAPTQSRANFARLLNLLPDFEQRVKVSADIRAKLNRALLAQKAEAIEQQRLISAKLNQRADAVLSHPKMLRRANLIQMCAVTDEHKVELLGSSPTPTRPRTLSIADTATEVLEQNRGAGAATPALRRVKSSPAGLAKK